MNKINLIIFTLIYLLNLTTNAHAYLDPFTGGVIIKIFIFIFSLILVFFKKVKHFLILFKNKVISRDKSKS